METYFHPSSKKKNVRIFSLIIGSIFMFAWLILTILESPRSTGFQLYCLSPSLFLLLLFSILDDFYYVNYEKLVLMPDKIRYQSLGLFVDVPWSKIKEIKYDPALMRRNIECLLFYGNYAKTNVLWFSKMQKKNLIPLTTFDDNWRDSQLGQQIKQYAPHLFEKANNPRKSV